MQRIVPFAPKRTLRRFLKTGMRRVHDCVRRAIVPLLAIFFALCGGTAISADSPSKDEPDDESETTAQNTPVEISKGETLFWEALVAFAEPRAESQAMARQKLEQAAALEYPHAQTTLANCLLTGSQGFKPDPRRAVGLLRFAAERKNGFAMASLGQCLTSGTGVRKNREEAIRWLEAALAKDADYSRPVAPKLVASKIQPTEGATIAGELGGDPAVASRANAHLLLAGHLAAQGDQSAAHLHYVAAAEAEGTKQGFAFAAIQAGINLAFGKGVPQNLEAANRMIDLSSTLVRRSSAITVHNYVALKMVDEFAAAEIEEEVSKQSESLAAELQKSIAETFANRKSKDYNPAQAKRWYGLAAENGDLWAAMDLALMLARGDLGEPDLAGARRWFERFHKKHTLAAGNYGICLQQGLGGPADPELARKIFEENRNYNLLCHLGSRGRAPLRPMSYDEMVKLEEQFIDEDPHVLFLRAYRYEMGYKVERDRIRAAKLYERAAKAGDGLACYRLALLVESLRGITSRFSSLDPIDLLSSARDRGVEEASFALGYRYFNGKGVQKNLDRAYEFYEEALRFDREGGGTVNNLGLILASRARDALTRGEREKAEKLTKDYVATLEKAMELKNATAAQNLGKFFSEEFEESLRAFIPADEERAFGYFVRAAEIESNAERHVYVAKRLEFGIGTTVNVREATYHYRLAALEGDLLGLRKMCAFYTQGKGGEVDTERAILWLDALARKGDLLAWRDYADVLIRLGKYKDARKLLIQLLDVEKTYIQGFANARLSMIYGKGLGVKLNPRKAENYRKEAIRLGFGSPKVTEALELYKKARFDDCIRALEDCADLVPEGQYKLGVLLYGDPNITVDQERAVKHLRLAAEENHLGACYFLGALAAKKSPHCPSPEEAKRFAQKALEGGFPGADKLLRTLSKANNDSARP